MALALQNGPDQARVRAQARHARLRSRLGALVVLPVVVAAIGGVAATLGPVSPVGATSNTRYVSETGSNSGDCSDPLNPCATISYAIGQASSGDTIYVSGTIDDNVTLPTSLTISQWPGESPAVVNAAEPGPVVYLSSGTDATLDGLSLTGGLNHSGGGITDNGGMITVNDSTIYDNTAMATPGPSPRGGTGGGIFDNNGTVVVNDSTIAGNTAEAASGTGPENDGGLGGGIFNNNGTVTVTDSTISGNSAATDVSAGAAGIGQGGGVFFNGGTDTMAGDIIATPGGAPAGGECADATPVDAGYNVDDDGSCGFSASGSTSDSSTIDSYLGTLANNGGSTETVALLPGNSGSPNPAEEVIPQGFIAPGQTTPVCAQPDERGVRRNSPCDMGAFALTSTLFVSTTGSDTSSCSSTENPCATITYALTQASSGDLIDVSGTIDDNVVIDTLDPITISQWPGASPAIIDGGGSPVFHIDDVATVVLEQLTIENGRGDPSGAGIDNDGTLTVTDSTISGNASGGEFGGGIYNTGTATVTDSTISGNTAEFGGGIFGAPGSTSTVVDSTITGNSAESAGGGIFNDAADSMTVVDSTIAGNTASSTGGGIANYEGPISVFDSTIDGNTASSLAAIWNGFAGFYGTFTMAGDIVATPGGPPAGRECGTGGLVDAGYNVDDDGSCGFTGTGSTSDSLTIDSHLGTLANNGGPTQTVALLPGSSGSPNPAQAVIPAGFTAPGQSTPACDLPDQRGDMRGVPCDIGSYALTQPAITSADATTFTATESGSFQVVGSWISGPSFAETGSLPSGVSLSSSGLLSGTPGSGSEGTYPIVITASVGGSPVASQNFTLTVAVNQQSQTIGSLSTPPSDAVVGGASYTPSATASSGLPVAVTVDPSSTVVCQISAGSVHFTSAGTCTLDFNQAGNIDWTAAAEVQQSFTVSAASDPARITSADSTVFGAYEHGSFQVTASVSGASFSETGTLPKGVSLSSRGLLAGSPESGIDVSYPVLLTASIGGHPVATQHFTLAVAKHARSQTIGSLSKPPSDPVVGGSAYAPTATASSGLPVDITVDTSSPPTCEMTGGAVHFTRTGTCTLDFNQSGNADWTAAPEVHQRITVSAPPKVRSSSGYWLVASDGGIFAYGHAVFYGSHGGSRLNKPIVGMSATHDRKGYWLVASDGGVFSYGDARFYGSHGGSRLNKPIVGMAVTRDGKGYWLVASDGGIFSYGDARFYGSHGGSHLNEPIVGMAITRDGKGYWLVASDGGIFSYGDARFDGSHGGAALNKPIVGMATTADGKGYWLVASDGGVFAYGDARFYGSRGGSHLNKPIVGMATTREGTGYWLTSSDGGVFAYGSASFHGSHGGSPLNSPVVGIARCRATIESSQTA